MDGILFLGTSAGIPTKARNVTSIAVRLSTGRIILVDCGEATQHQLLKSSDLPTAIRLSKVDAILITHMHGDHIFGLPGVLASISLSQSQGEDQKRQITVIGPVGIKQFVETTLSLSCTFITYPLKILELQPGSTIQGLDLGVSGITADCYPLLHAQNVPCFGYSFQEQSKPGSLDANKAASLGARGKILGELKAGKAITLPNGAVIKPEDVIGPPKRGRKLVILGDTSKPLNDSLEIACGSCGNSSGFVDLLVHEATFGQNEEDKAKEGGHSTSIMAAEFAKRIHARKLILTHFSQRYTNSDSTTIGKTDVEQLAIQARSVYPDCEILSANELTFYSLPQI